ncbi:metal ABC transporter permease [Photobacterium angustum]|uniref:Cation ABC transporter, permease protein n=1 Tax=Photobacterium angustum (strain S14 / CCUG 15956) TaxID=314292 RepID=Q1ZMV9_PHOAS|nr:metal ABC transporter permease [Photobacterium angustum]EAS63579.1 cation ABC transporter, permease protein [Vibrio angustum S14] [Photobacterium angustum S14]
MIELLQYNFIQHALIAAVLVSIVAGIIGVLVVTNRLVFLSGGIVHTAYGGVGLAFYAGTAVMPTTLVFTSINALLLGALSQRKLEQLDIFIGLIWSLGMAIGIILMALTPGYGADLSSYLFGSILTVPVSTLYLMGGSVLIIGAYTIYNYRSLVLMSFDADFAQSKGVKVKRMYLSLLVLVAIASVILVKVVGIVLVMALLTMPAYMAAQYTKSMLSMMCHSILWCLGFTLTGLIFSYQMNLPSGATIVVTASICLALQLGLREILKFFKKGAVQAA